MVKRIQKPLTLDQMTTIRGIPSSEAYGADHSPSFDQNETNRLYKAAVETLAEEGDRLDSLELLTLLAAIEHMTTLQEPPQRIGIAAVELAQAQLLRSAFPGEALTSAAAENFMGAVTADLHLFLDQTAKPPTDEKGQVLSRRRMQTLLVRHTFYAHHAAQIFRRVARNLERVELPSLGLTLGQASMISMAFAVAVQAALNSSNLKAVIPEWLAGNIERFDPAWTKPYEIDPTILSPAIPDVGVATLAKLLDRLSMAEGELRDADPAHLHLDNPIWRRPFVKHQGRWFCFSPGTLLSSQFDIMAELASDISERPGELVGKARGTALEDMLVEALKQMLPHAEVLRSVKWDDAVGKEFETDAIALIDGLVLIFEAKGDALSMTGRRGSNKWLRDFDDIAVEAAVQSWRLEQALRDQKREAIELRADGRTVRLRLDDVRHVVRFGVSLERVTMASFGLEGHLRARIERAGGMPMPILTIGDLWQVRDLLGSEGHCLHFLLRRNELERDFEFIADELDLIAHYLRTGFVRLWNDVEDRSPVALYGLSDFLRFYQKGSSHYDATVKLPKRTTAWWDKLIREREERRVPGWTDMVYDLLNIPLLSQKRFEEDVRKLRRKVRRLPGQYPREGLLMQAPHQLRPSAFACIAMGRMSSADRIALARGHFTELLESHPDERLFVFVLDTASANPTPALPYYRGIAWDQHVENVGTEGEGVASGLFFEVDASEATP
ncbi:hypothetical protein [Sphingomonas faeni]|uniref:hypothetical protein n=1 Tax=Sphingomonas faeni TaxID=185950 RepID=UPI003352F42A